MNGDGEAAVVGAVVWTTTPTADLNIAGNTGLSSTGLLEAGVDRHSITIDISNLSNGLGYTIVDDSTAALTVTPKVLTITDLSSRSKVYDGTTMALVQGSGEMAGLYLWLTVSVVMVWRLRVMMSVSGRGT